MTEPTSLALPAKEESTLLAQQWRLLGRAATFVAILTSPAVFVYLHKHEGWNIGWSVFVSILAIAAFRGFVDLVLRRAIPWPSLFGTDDARLRDEDVVNRRRVTFWHFIWVLVRTFLVVVLLTLVYRALVHGWGAANPVTVTKSVAHWLVHLKSAAKSAGPFLVILPLFFVFNFVILMGPMLLMGITQIRGFEPGDADWGVRLEDVRGQKEAKEEVRRIVSLWQSGQMFEAAGGKRERGLLFLGAPGTGKTMLAKAIATGFNCFAPTERFMTKDGFKTFAEAAGTEQLVLTRDGTWAPAEIRSFGRQPLVEVVLRPGVHTRSSVRRVIHATPTHRWLTTNRDVVTDLSSGDFLPFQAPPAAQRVDEAFIRGFGYGDGTLDTRGRARIRLCGDKDHRHLPLFTEFGHCFVSYPPSYGGDPLVVFNGGVMSDWKELPTGDEDPDWIASWVDGYVAADGWHDGTGAVVLETQDAEAIEFVAQVAAYAGYMVVGRHVKAASLVTNYGVRSAPLNALKLRREGVWQVLEVKPLPIESDVYCAVEPTTETFTLAGGVLTGNCPFISIPGSGFAQTFMGMDVIIVRYLARKAKKLASKWGGQCIVFIDEIDAVGRRRAGVTASMAPPTLEDYLFFGQHGALNPSGDMILETRAWRDKLFAARAPEPRTAPSYLQRIFNQLGVAGGMMGGSGQLALNQLLIVMDGVDNPPFFRRVFTNRINQFLDASYIVPYKVRGRTLRLPKPKPRKDQIYFIGATNVPIEQLDPALTRPGRMGRHVWFRTPTKQDRLDIFELYIKKVAHDPELDRPERRDEIARITSGYAQPLNCKVLTPTGWTEMGEIKAGDLVIGSNGSPTPVRAIHPRGEMDVFRVKFNDGTWTECTADHLWTVEAMDPRMVPRTLTLHEILKRKLRWSPRGSSFYLPKLAPAEFLASSELPIDPYLLGLLLGDGGFTQGSPDFCTADAENLAAVEALVPAGVSPTRHGPMNWRLTARQSGVAGSNPLTERLRTLGLWGENCYGKYVPERYKWASVPDRLALLQGLMDTDGTVDYRRGTGPTFYSHSRTLAEDVVFLVRSLGGTARLRPKREGWRVALDLPEGFVPFRLTRKASVYRSSRKPFRKRIRAVEFIGPKPVQCITVAAADGLYVTDGFTVTHNSPAMIEQVCSLALTYAHHEGHAAFEWPHLVEAMVTLESGTAIGIDYVPVETRWDPLESTCRHASLSIL